MDILDKFEKLDYVDHMELFEEILETENEDLIVAYFNKVPNFHYQLLPPNVLRRLVKEGFNFYQSNNDGFSFLSYIIMHDDVDSIKTLLDEGIDFDKIIPPKGCTVCRPICCGVNGYEKPNFDNIFYLLDTGKVKVYTEYDIDSDGQSLFDYAIIQNDYDIFKKLLTYITDEKPDFATYYEYSYIDNDEFVEELRQLALNDSNKKGTPLIIAVMNRDVEEVKRLMKIVDVNETYISDINTSYYNPKPKTALDIAKEYGLVEMIKILDP